MRNLIWLITLLVAGCTAEEIGPQSIESSDPTLIKGRKVMLINEGNFGRGNASISAYVPAKKAAYQQIFSGANEDRRLGDVGQSISAHDNYYYIVVNASGYIAVIDTVDMRITDSIQGNMVAPRYMAMSDGKGFVTDLYTNKLWVVNLQTNQEEGHISLPGSGKRVLSWQDLIVVSIGDQIAMVNPILSQLDTIINMGSTVEGIVEAKDGALWVLTSGNSNRMAELIRLSPGLGQTEAYTVSNQKPGYLTINPNSNTLYYVEDDGIYSAQYDGSSISRNKVYSILNENVYAFEVDPSNGELYLVDALDFDQRSDVYRISSSGILLDEFKAGIITSDFYFTP